MSDQHQSLFPITNILTNKIYYFHFYNDQIIICKLADLSESN